MRMNRTITYIMFMSIKILCNPHWSTWLGYETLTLVDRVQFPDAELFLFLKYLLSLQYKECILRDYNLPVNTSEKNILFSFSFMLEVFTIEFSIINLIIIRH